MLEHLEFSLSFILLNYYGLWHLKTGLSCKYVLSLMPRQSTLFSFYFGRGGSRIEEQGTHDSDYNSSQLEL